MWEGSDVHNSSQISEPMQVSFVAKTASPKATTDCPEHHGKGGKTDKQFLTNIYYTLTYQSTSKQGQVVSEGGFKNDSAKTLTNTDSYYRKQSNFELKIIFKWVTWKKII